MPSGVSAATTVSSIPWALGELSRLDDDGVGNLVVQTLPRFTEDEEQIDQAVERDDADQSVDDVAQPEDASERNRRSVGAHDLDPQQLLGDRLSVLRDVLDREPAPDDEPDERDPEAGN